MSTDDVSIKVAVAEGLYRYCRSLDRMDEGLYATVFDAGARLDYGAYFSGSAEEFREWVWSAHEGMQGHSHQITNILVEIDAGGGRAVSEAYVTVCLRTRADAEGRVLDIVDRGRYLDEWTRTGAGSWRITTRRYLSDIQQVADASTAPPVTLVRDRTDPSYVLFS